MRSFNNFYGIENLELAYIIGNKEIVEFIKDTQIFVENHIRPIEVIILGAVHIAQYLIDFIKNLNFKVTIIDPRKYFISNQRFKNAKIINNWPKEAFKTIKTKPR